MDILGQVSVALGVIALLGATLWFLRTRGVAQFTLRRPRGRASRRLESIERLPLTPHHSLHLVRVADRLVLIGLSPASCTLLESSAAEERFPELERLSPGQEAAR